MIKSEILNAIEETAQEADFTTDRKEAFIKGLEENEDLLSELDFYLANNDFLCKTKVCGYSIVDILVWQIDHFRAFLDRETSLTKRNPKAMGVLAVETMINMRKNPEKYIAEFTNETGTDKIN